MLTLKKSKNSVCFAPDGGGSTTDEFRGKCKPRENVGSLLINALSAGTDLALPASALPQSGPFVQYLLEKTRDWLSKFLKVYPRMIWILHWLSSCFGLVRMCRS